MKISKNALHIIFNGLILLSLLSSFYLVNKFQGYTELITAVSRILVIQVALLLVAYFILFRKIKSVQHQSLLSLTQYRVVKMLFRKHIHDAANKMQIILGQVLIAKKETATEAEVLEIVTRIKATTHDQVESLKNVRKNYLAGKEKIFSLSDVPAETVYQEISASFTKRMAARNVTFQSHYASKEITLALEMTSFYKFVISNLLGYIVENCLEGSTIHVGFSNTKDDLAEIKIDFAGVAKEKIKSINSEMLNSPDEDNPFLVAHDFVSIIGGKLYLKENESLHKGATFVVNLNQKSAD